MKYKKSGAPEKARFLVVRASFEFYIGMLRMWF